VQREVSLLIDYLSVRCIETIRFFQSHKLGEWDPTDEANV
jgi:hypothetical protein